MPWTIKELVYDLECWVIDSTEEEEQELKRPEHAGSLLEPDGRKWRCTGGHKAVAREG